MNDNEHGLDRVTTVGPADIIPPGQPGRPKSIRARRCLTAISLVCMGVGFGAIAAEVTPTQALMTATAEAQHNSATALTCIEHGQPKPPGSKLKNCPPTPPGPSGSCKENVLDSQSPASTQKDPIGTVPVTLSAVYHDETPMDRTTNVPTLSIDGVDQADAWTNLLTSSGDTSPKKDDFRTTVSYLVPASYDDGDLHTFVITFYDGDADRSDGCGIATFSVQSPPPVMPPPPTATCHEDVLASQSPNSTANAPITTVPTQLTAVYTDEKQMNTTTKPPTLSIDGVAQVNPWPSAFEPVDTTSQVGHNYVTPVTYDVSDAYADGDLHTFVITVYDGDNDGCGVATFYVKTGTP